MIRHRQRRGTTVLELVVALVVTGAVAAAGAAAFRQTIDRRTQLLTSARNTERAAAMRSLLREWLSGGTLVWPPAASGISFVSNAVTPAGAPGRPLRLVIDDDVATPETGLVLEYRLAPEQPLTRRVIDADITRLTVEYFDGESRSWTTAENPPTNRPLALRLTLAGMATEDGAAANAPAVSRDKRLQLLPLTIVLNATPAASGAEPAP